LLQIDPDFFESISNRSASHLALRDYARAIDDSDKASIALLSGALIAWQTLSAPAPFCPS
jgi:hypothetical protein